jgi:hypothetical protein
MDRRARRWAGTVAALVAVALAGASCSAPTARPEGDAAVSVPGDGASAPPSAPEATGTAAEANATLTNGPAAGAPSAPAAGEPFWRRPGWVREENARPGTPGWRLGPGDAAAWVDAYADRTSVSVGDSFRLMVDTASPAWSVRAYRLGFYGGAGARLVWQSPEVPGRRQPAAVVDKATGMAEARWAPSLSVGVDDAWTPGVYVLVVSTGRGGVYVPLTVRDDAVAADLLVLQAVTTWQAYNPWGGCSLYSCTTQKGRSRATVVSFDRPYARSYNDGSADLLDHDQPLISFVEELGLDVDYATSVDLDERPVLASRRHGVVSPGHDEYYSTAMRQGLEDALGAGTNLAFLGANAVYRHIRLEPGHDGAPDRRVVNYRSAAADPARAPADKTVEWRLAPLNRPEAALVGIQYACAGVNGDLRVAGADHWVWAGTGVRDGQVLPSLVGNEYDAVAPGVSPAGLVRLARSPVRCGGRTGEHAMAYRVAPSGAGVFATGTIWWPCALDGSCSPAANAPFVRGATGNVLRRFAAGPARG